MNKYYVYAIKSLKDSRIYVGISTQPIKRLKEHNNGKVKSTQFYRPWKLIYKKYIGDRKIARTKEKKLKSGYGKEFLKNL